MNFDNSVRDARGEVIGFRCDVCDRVVSKMWGTTCNLCRKLDKVLEAPEGAAPAVSREAEGAQTEGLRDQKFTARMLDAAKFLALAVSPCGSDGEHSWRECPRCLAEHELEARGEGFWNGKPRQPSKAVELLRELAEVVPKLLAAPTVAQAPQDESELDRLVVAYKHIADNDGEHRIKDLVWLINELIYERDQRKAK
jgi:hypothetical protein